MVNIFKMPVHPEAEKFPMLDDEELNDLAEDIKENGLVHPLVTKDGYLIDGRNRREACQRVGIEPTTIELDGQDPKIYILSVNFNRRHMNKSQRVMVLAMLYPDPEKTKRKGVGSGSLLSKERISGARLSQARTVLKWSPPLAEEVLTGQKPLNEAYEEISVMKRREEAIPGRLEKLRKLAPDLAVLVEEERMKIGEAEAALQERINEEERRKRTFWELLSRLENITDWVNTSDGIEHGRRYIANFPDECPIKKPKQVFAKLANQFQKLSESL